jgi:hypothetical protein
VGRTTKIVKNMTEQNTLQQTIATYKAVNLTKWRIGNGENNNRIEATQQQIDGG